MYNKYTIDYDEETKVTSIDCLEWCGKWLCIMNVVLYGTHRICMWWKKSEKGIYEIDLICCKF